MPPASGRRPSSVFIIVVLPVPFVPTMAVTEPAGMEKSPCCQISRSPRFTEALLNTMQFQPLFPVAAVAVHMIHRPVCTGPASRPPVRHVRQRIIAKDYDNHSH